MNPKYFYLLLFFALVSSAQNKPQKWVFHGIRVEEKVPGCVNNPCTRYESFWLPLNAQYNMAYDSLKAKMKQKYGDQYVNIDRIYSRSGEKYVIALIQKKWKCGANNYSFYEGKNSEEIIANVERDKISYNLVSYQQVYMINCEEEIAKLEKKEKPQADKSAIIEADYSGVQAKYKYVTNARASFAFVVLHNTNKDVTALVKFTLDDKTVITVDIPPGNKTNRNIYSPSFTVDVSFIPYKSSNGPGVIDMVKKKIKDIVSTKDKKINSAIGSIGVRG